MPHRCFLGGAIPQSITSAAVPTTLARFNSPLPVWFWLWCGWLGARRDDPPTVQCLQIVYCPIWHSGCRLHYVLWVGLHPWCLLILGLLHPWFWRLAFYTFCRWVVIFSPALGLLHPRIWALLVLLSRFCLHAHAPEYLTQGLQILLLLLPSPVMLPFQYLYQIMCRLVDDVSWCQCRLREMPVHDLGGVSYSVGFCCPDVASESPIVFPRRAQEPPVYRVLCPRPPLVFLLVALDLASQRYQQRSIEIKWPIQICMGRYVGPFM